MPVKREPGNGRFVANSIGKLELALALVQQGCPITAACAKNGIHYDTWKDHAANRAPAARLKPVKTQADRRLIAWADAAALAVQGAEGWLYQWFLDEAAKPPMKGNWMAPFKVLARRFPERWAERRFVEPPVEDEASEFDLQRLTRDELRTLREIVLKAKEGPPDGRKLRVV